jgi:hypothetical protein
MTYKIIMIKIDQRSQEAGLVQKVLTEFGCNIKVRLGLHDISSELCATDGLVILQVEGNQEDLTLMLIKLNNIDYVQAQLLEM